MGSAVGKVLAAVAPSSLREGGNTSSVRSFAACGLNILVGVLLDFSGIIRQNLGMNTPSFLGGPYLGGRKGCQAERKPGRSMSLQE